MLDLAELAHKRLAAISGIVVGPAPATSIVTFRAWSGDEATDRIVAALHGTGRFQISTTSIGGNALIRFAFLSPRTTEAHVIDALEVVSAVAAGSKHGAHDSRVDRVTFGEPAKGRKRRPAN